jgi:hypothetical protein
MMRTLAGTALCAAAYISGAIQVPTNIIPMAAHEVVTVKPAKTKKPLHDDDCVPTAVVTHPSGVVAGEEDCNGEKRYTRLN